MQKNDGVITIEHVLEKAIVKSSGISASNAGTFSKVSWQRAARTDKGVHAIVQTVSLKMVLVDDIVRKINENLPPSIRVYGYSRTISSFDAKDSCDARQYEYLLPTNVLISPDAVNTENQFNETTLEKLNLIFSKFKGTHSFHNFTSGKPQTDPSAKRFIISVEASKPFIISGIEFIRINIVGQSFLLHMIRKIIGTTILIMRGEAPPEIIDVAFSLPKLATPLAPSLGLSLHHVIYEKYNTLKGAFHKPLQLDEWKDQIDTFSQHSLYPHIAELYKSQTPFDKWFSDWKLIVEEQKLNYFEIVNSKPNTNETK